MRRTLAVFTLLSCVSGTTSIAAGTYRLTATRSGFTDSPVVSVPAGDTTLPTDSLALEGAADDQILRNTIDAVVGIGTIVRVDGLPLGGLPPAATIQQIRIRLNSFDAEYHDATPALVETITNSKSQPWQVSFTTWDRPQAAPARNAFAVDDAPATRRGGVNINGTGLGVRFFQGIVGAGYGDRTRVRGLGSLCTTIVLSPRESIF